MNHVISIIVIIVMITVLIFFESHHIDTRDGCVRYGNVSAGLDTSKCREVINEHRDNTKD